MTAVDILHFFALVSGGSAIMAVFVSLISDEPVRCGFDVVNGAGK